MFIHAAVPPGVETMKRLNHEIAYKAELAAKVRSCVLLPAVPKR